jgi:uncharacterized membrane protein
MFGEGGSRVRSSAGSGSSGAVPGAADIKAAVWLFVGVAGLAAAITILFLSMRAVMQIGGYCASGGPYVIATPCPKGIPLLMIGSVWGGLACLFVCIYQSAKAHVPNIAPLAWPALFLALGYNFLVYGFDPPGDAMGIVWSWVICGMVFVGIGLGPLVLGLLVARGTRSWRVKVQPVMTPDVAARLLRARDSFRAGDDAASRPGPESGTAAGAPDPDHLVSMLERLSELHRRGDISDEEFRSAKDSLLGRSSG